MTAEQPIGRTGATLATGAELSEPIVPGWLGRAAVEIAEKLHAAALRTAETELSELLQLPVSMKPGDTTQIPFSALFGEIPSGDHLIPLDLTPLRGHAYLLLPSRLLFRLLDILLATSENPPDDSIFLDASRSATSIEIHILRDVFEILTRTVRDVWQPCCGAAFRQIPPEDESGIPGPEDAATLALNLAAAVDLAGVSAGIQLIVPAYLGRLAQLKTEMPLDSGDEPKPVLEGILNCLGSATLRVEAVLNGTSIGIDKLLALTPGQILTLGNTEDSPVDCLVNREKQFRGQILASGGRYALRVDELSGETQRHSVDGSSADR